jgi:two-component sensor histidine kinase
MDARDTNGPLPAPARTRRRDGPGVPSLLLFASVAAALIAATGVIYGTVRAERAQREQAARTSEVLTTLRDIGRSTTNAETGQRGYLITLDRRYLAPYQLGAASYPVDMRRLHALLDPDATPRQRALMEQVQRLADAKFAEMAESVALIDDRRILDAQQAMLSDEGEDLMVELRATLSELEAIERRALIDAGRDSARLEGRVFPLLGGLVAIIAVALALGLWLVIRAARAEAAASQAQALSDARDRADLLARELNHRVKNLFAVILAIVRMSGKGDPAAKPTVDKIVRRIHALVTAHDVTQGAAEGTATDLRALIETALAPYRSDSERCTIEGEPLALPARATVPLGLMLHELATNAVKYGAWSSPGGLVAVRWSAEAGRVHLTWREEGEAPAAPQGREGFGTQLIDSSARQIRGTVSRSFHPGGIEVRIEFPAH